MKVLKFGGGCLKDAKSIKKLPSILKNYGNDIIIVISAFGKLTNLLEKIHLSHQKDYNTIHIFFKQIMRDLLLTNAQIDSVLIELSNLFSRINFSRADILSIGELISSKILSEYFKKIEINHNLLNASKIIRTKSRGINASLDLDATMNQKNIYQKK